MGEPNVALETTFKNQSQKVAHVQIHLHFSQRNIKWKAILKSLNSTYIYWMGELPFDGGTVQNDWKSFDTI